MEKSSGEFRKKSRVWSSIPTIVLTNEGKGFMAKHCTVLATFPKSKFFFFLVWFGVVWYSPGVGNGQKAQNESTWPLSASLGSTPNVWCQVVPSRWNG